jgi:hypothetical protein
LEYRGWDLPGCPQSEYSRQCFAPSRPAETPCTASSLCTACCPLPWCQTPCRRCGTASRQGTGFCSPHETSAHVNRFREWRLRVQGSRFFIAKLVECACACGTLSLRPMRIYLHLCMMNKTWTETVEDISDLELLIATGGGVHLDGDFLFLARLGQDRDPHLPEAALAVDGTNLGEVASGSEGEREREREVEGKGEGEGERREKETGKLRRDGERWSEGDRGGEKERDGQVHGMRWRWAGGEEEGRLQARGIQGLSGTCCPDRRRGT